MTCDRCPTPRLPGTSYRMTIKDPTGALTHVRFLCRACALELSVWFLRSPERTCPPTPNQEPLPL